MVVIGKRVKILVDGGDIGGDVVGGVGGVGGRGEGMVMVLVIKMIVFSKIMFLYCYLLV